VVQIFITDFYYSKFYKYCNATETTKQLTTPLQYDAAFICLGPCLSIIPRRFAVSCRSISYHLHHLGLLGNRGLKGQDHGSSGGDVDMCPVIPVVPLHGCSEEPSVLIDAVMASDISVVSV
jgi:hypothetical protein